MAPRMFQPITLHFNFSINMKKIIVFFTVLHLLSFSVYSQPTKTPTPFLQRPKLVVGIVIDQMRWDFLYRFDKRYLANGFKRLLANGFSCENTFIPYLPTYTAPGHTCIYTGSVPAIHGIIGNNWYDRNTHKQIYCTDDTTVHSVGSTSDAGNMSPANLWTSTITDELRLATNFKSKVIGIALKDRGAILPAGHAANAAYWFDNANGAFISSTYYMIALPEWVNQFNIRKLPGQYLQTNWNTLYPIDTYAQSDSDRKTYEKNLPGEDNTFPHHTADISKEKYDALRTTPYGNTLTIEMAKAAIKGEQLGKSGNTDFLAVSFSSTDYVGHTFGPNSIEAEDTYLRLDKDLASFLNYLDSAVGKGQYTVFLTADHGAAHIPGYAALQAHLPGGSVSANAIQAALNDTLNKYFKPKNGVEEVINEQVYLSRDLNDSIRLAIKSLIVRQLLAMPFVANAVDLSQVSNASLIATQKTMLTNGYNQKISGDIQFLLKPQWIEGSSKGTTHGAWNPYDAHIPLVWFGWGINKGSTNRETYMTDIAATVAALLHIQMPNGCIGKVIQEVVK